MLRLRHTFLLALLGTGLLAQTLVDLRTQSRGIDFQAAPYTKPLKAGAVLPANCTTNELFFLTSAPSGANLYACVSNNTWALEAGNASLSGDVTGTAGATTVQRLQGRGVSSAVPQLGQGLVWDGSTWSAQNLASGGGAVTVEADGMVVGTRGIQNFIAGIGVFNTISDSGTAIGIRASADTAVLLTQSHLQSGQPLLCQSDSGSGSTYSCSMLPILESYQPGMVLHWRPDVAGTGGVTTLDVDILGETPIKMADGVTDPVAGDIAGGQQYAIWFDGTNFRLPGPPSPSTGAAGTRPLCDPAHRSRIWQGLGGPGVKDEIAICVKDAGDAYAWQVLY